MPLKPPHAGKSRLRGVSASTSAVEHAALVLALAADTLTAAVTAPGVRRVVVVATDPAELADLRDLDVELVAEPGTAGLNGALRHGAAVLRGDDPAGVIAALQADLPALRPAELAAALGEADGRRAFTADRHGTGTTLLVSAPGGPLDPRFGAGSADAHAASGAVPLGLDAPSLRGDVDTPGDLDHARALGLGRHTAALLGVPRAA
ncbi:2-phospho-L-lactate guanylyltransferase [Amycolatopsis arida]|uniref:2-phospho-L-lactate guanylyltransferase n=1 Tax=Amycolatopsis arida TaxID=587909 RepID=A0A1I5NSQ0_9PSEU|nr:2-phospho-L-lactate guanylyltransferase [Amycolatopsis arida]SFP24803.1 2-phospho-L-lactate guanylyltransferase [Amycolatopsis arida]